MSSSAALMAGMAGTPGNGTRSGHPEGRFLFSWGMVPVSYCLGEMVPVS